jgi:hypothetical protein
MGSISRTKTKVFRLCLSKNHEGVGQLSKMPVSSTFQTEKYLEVYYSTFLIIVHKTNPYWIYKKIFFIYSEETGVLKSQPFKAR